MPNGDLDTGFDGDGRYTATYGTYAKDRIYGLAPLADGKFFTLGGYLYNWRVGRYTGIARVAAQASDTIDVTDSEPARIAAVRSLPSMMT